MVGETAREPAVVPDQPSLALQPVALLLDQLSVEDWPEVMEVGEAEKEVMVGGGGGGVLPTVTVALPVAGVVPEAPVQVRV